MNTTFRWRHAWAMGLSLALMTCLAALHLPYPFHGDQAFTLVAAQALDRGATLYVDFWDIRQPGAIWFFWVAGRLFGFHEAGVHSLEMLWMAAASVVALAIARRLVTRSYLAWLAPVTTVGVYYAHARPWELTQPEALLMLPLAICLLLALGDRPSLGSATTMGRWALFGVAAGVVVIFKLLLVVIPAGLGITAAIFAVATREARVRDVVRLRLLPAAGGLLLVLLPAIGYFWRRGALDELYWTTFVAPVLSVAQIPRGPYHRLVTSVGWFSAIWLPAAPLLWLGARVRHQPKPVLLLMTWVAAAAGAILLQRFHYWPYHFLLFVMPLGLLVLRGADAALDRIVPAGEYLGVTLVLVPVLLTAALPVGPKVLAIYDAMNGSGGVGDGYRRLMSPTYTPSRAAAAAISETAARPGPVFVFGNPQILVYSGRSQAIPLRGWALYSVLDEQWAAYPSLLKDARPVYVFIGEGGQPDIERRSPATMALLSERYRPFWKGAAGEWYELTDARAQ